MSAASLDTSVPVMPMATPIFAVLSAGASLMPSPVIATMWPLRCSDSTIRSLWSGSTRAKTRTCSTMASSSRVVHVAQLGAGDEARARLEDVELARDRAGGRRVVAGDHDGADVRAPRDRDRLLHLLARRIDHADDPEQHEIVLDALRQLDVGRGIVRDRCPSDAAGTRARGDRERAQAPGSASASLRRDQFGARRRRSARPACRRRHDIAALREQDLRRALDEDAAASPGWPDRRARVVWRLRSEVNGISAMRGTRASSCSVRPNLRAATISAPSVGSPCTFQRPSLLVSAASLTSAAARSVRVTAAAQRRVLRERLAVAG